MDNIKFIHCDEDLHPDARSLFISALHKGVYVPLQSYEIEKVSQSLAEEINIAPVGILAKHIGTGVEVYVMSDYFMNIEYDTMDERWHFLIEEENLSNVIGVKSIPLLFVFLHNAFANTLDEYKDYDVLEVTQDNVGGQEQ